MGGHLTKLKNHVNSTVEEKTSQMMEKQIKTQLTLQNEMRQKQIAMQIGMSRERFVYYNFFYCCLAPLLLIGGVKTKNPKLVVPLLPLSVAYAFQYDMAYGAPWHDQPSMVRGRIAAEKILNGEDQYIDMKLLGMPNGMPTFAEIQDKASQTK